MNRFLRTFVAATLLAIGAVAPVSAASPSNDDIANPIVIGALPASISIDACEATTGPTDPGYCPAPEFGPDPATVWFQHTAASDGPLGATTYGSDYPTTLYVGTADGNGGLDVIGCATQSGGTAQSAVRFEAEAGVTYLFAVGLDPFFGEPAGNLVFDLDVAGPALTVDIEVEPTAELVRDGVAVVRGTFTCTAPSTFSTLVAVELTQVTGGRVTHGFGIIDITDCPADELPFAVEVSDDDPFGESRGRNRPLVPGSATIQVIAGACDLFVCANETIDMEVVLER
jgi:hypothetical protein